MTATAKPTRDSTSKDFRRFGGDCGPWGRVSSKADVARFKVSASKICKAFPGDANNANHFQNIWLCEKSFGKTFPGGKIDNEKRVSKLTEVVSKSRDRLYSSFSFSQSFRVSGIPSQTSPLLGQSLFHDHVKVILNRPKDLENWLGTGQKPWFWCSILRPSSKFCQMLPELTGWQFAPFLLVVQPTTFLGHEHP